MSEEMITCAYCGDIYSRTLDEITDHVINCKQRPEAMLLVKISVLEETGDVLLETIHSVVKALAETEGMRSKSWEIYRLAKIKWEEVKRLSPEEMVQIIQETENVEEKEKE